MKNSPVILQHIERLVEAKFDHYPLEFSIALYVAQGHYFEESVGHLLIQRFGSSSKVRDVHEALAFQDAVVNESDISDTPERSLP